MKKHIKIVGFFLSVGLLNSACSPHSEFTSQLEQKDCKDSGGSECENDLNGESRLGTNIFSFTKDEGDGDEEVLPFEPEKMRLLFSLDQVVNAKDVHLFEANIDFQTGDEVVSGQVTPHIDASGSAVTIRADDQKGCMVKDRLPTSDLEALKTLIRAIRICHLEQSMSGPVPPLAVASREDADLIFTKGSDKLYLSNLIYYVTQYPDTKSVCEKAPELEEFFVQRLSGVMAEKCVTVAE